ncbi:MAG: diaminopimelate epimerase [Eubacterium sp.]|nr:diaminopimelate epimerase [Eubacterium sp.]
MKFTKMHGAGNDYVYVNCFEERVDDPSALAIKVSDRHFGVGSDGLILIKPTDKADFEMDMYNSDGSRGAMCGNGIRCVAKYVYDHGLTDKTEITVDTQSGVKTLQLFVEDGKVKTVRVDMGEPILKSSDIPVVCESETVVDEPIEALGKTYRMTCVSMGNPHSLCFIDCDPSDFDLETVGPAFESHERFPERVNAGFIHVVDRSHTRVRVYERGTGETLACGTNACAGVVACVLNGLTDRAVHVQLPGGELFIEWNEQDNHVYMTGPAATTFEGVLEV